MPAVSQKQQKFMGIVHGLQKGTTKPSKVSGKAKKAAKTMSTKAAKDFASTPRKGLPVRVKGEAVNDDPNSFKKYKAGFDIGDYGAPVKSNCPNCGNKWAADLGKDRGMQFHGCLKCNKTYIPNAGVKSEGAFDVGTGHQRGTSWEVKNPEDPKYRFGAKNKSGATRYFSNKQSADRFSKTTGDTRYHENVQLEGKQVKKIVKEDLYNTGPFNSPKDSYRKGTTLSQKVRSGTDAMRSDDRDDMGRRRPAAEDLNNSMRMIEQYNEYGKALKRENKMKEIAEKLVSIAETAEMATMNEADDWFDKHTVSRNMKEMKKYATDFSKLSEEADALNDRMTALYDDMGHVLNRYFDIKEQDEPDYPEIDAGDMEDEGDDMAPAGMVKEQAMSKPFECQECHKRLSTAQAERAMNGDSGCPGCGGSDIDVAAGLGESGDSSWIVKKEIKDKDYRTTRDRVLAAKPRNVQDAEDRKRGHLPGFTDEVSASGAAGSGIQGINPAINKDPYADDLPQEDESHVKEDLEGDEEVGRAMLKRSQKNVNEPDLSPKQRAARQKSLRASNLRMQNLQKRKDKEAREAEAGGEAVREITLAQEKTGLNLRHGSRTFMQTLQDEDEGLIPTQPGEAWDRVWKKNRPAKGLAPVAKTAPAKATATSYIKGENVRPKKTVKENDPKYADASAYDRPMDNTAASGKIMSDPVKGLLSKTVGQITKNIKTEMVKKIRERKAARLREAKKAERIRQESAITPSRLKRLAGISRENAMPSGHELQGQPLTQKQYDKNPAGSKVTVRGKKSIVRPPGFAPDKVAGGTYAQPVQIVKGDDKDGD